VNVSPTALPGVLLLAPAVFHDDRGYFLECWSRERYNEAGLPTEFSQDNVSYSRRGVVRGLHYQLPCEQGKLVSVLRGEVFDVAVDIRLDSPDFGRWTGHVLSAANAHQLYVPPGFAHGFAVVSDDAILCYKCTASFAPGAEGSVAWNDPAIGIEWPVSRPLMSAKDRAAPRLRDVAPERLPRVRGLWAASLAPRAATRGAGR
jgi:dTDP-4-dehydrorhamnose 3,5-epimerase